MCSRSYYADEDEHVARERGYVEVLEGNQRYKIWRSLLISFILELMIFE